MIDLKHTTKSIFSGYSNKTFSLPSRKSVTTSHTSLSTKEKKVKRWKTIFAILGGYLLVFFILYLFGNPTAVSTVNFITGRSGATKFVYHTYKISFDDTVSKELQDQISSKLTQIKHEGTQKYTFTGAEESDYQIGVHAGQNTDDKDARLLYASYLVPVGHIYWIKDGVSTSDLTSNEIVTSEKDKNFVAMVVEKQLGKKPTVESSANPFIELNGNESIIGLIDIGELQKDYKLLTLDGNYFLDKAPNGGIPYGLYLTKNKMKDFSGAGVIEANLETALPAKFAKEDVLKVNMTGVTAISRGLAIKTNNAKNGGYAASKIADFLADADLTHTSNEVSFVDGCSPAGSTMRFCSHPSYIEALEKSGIDIVELTGNHNNDYGASWNAKTIEMYAQRKWDYFGGGLNSPDAGKILYKDMKGTKLALVGYNYYDTVLGTGALAGAARAGANSWSVAKIKSDVEKARQEGANTVIVTIQYQECWAYTVGNTICYGPIGSPNQERDFRAAVDAGADIVIGTQAHQPQTYEIYNGKIIFYGLGNLFFDQIQWLGTRQGLVLTHYFYKGKYLTTKLTTTIYDNDMKTYVTTGTERERLLKQLKGGR